MDLTATRTDTKLLVDDIMRQWPATVAVFIQWKMKCIGCPFGVFHSIELACEEHSLELAPIAAELDRAIEGSESGQNQTLGTPLEGPR